MIRVITQSDRKVFTLESVHTFSVDNGSSDFFPWVIHIHEELQVIWHDHAAVVMISSGATFYSREAPRGSIHSLKEGREDRNENIPSIQDLLEKYQRYRVWVLFNSVHRFRLLSMTNIYLLSLMMLFCIIALIIKIIIG